MRDRLIELLKDYCKYDSCLGKQDTTICEDCQIGGELADHLLADGWIRPPCKVGQMVWVIVGRMLPHIAECEVVSVTHSFMGLGDRRKVFTFSVVAKDSITPDVFIDSDINRRVFFAPEDAEKSLAERSEK